jgi:hypothetical protein
MIRNAVVAGLMACFPLLGETLAGRAAALLAEQPDARWIEGREGWIFLAGELRHLARGADWVAPETPPDPPHADPLPALRLLRDQLAELNTRLVVIPVPAKAAVYPEFLPGEGVPSVERPSAFVRRLLEESFEVLDLRSVFAEAKTEIQLYCRTDTHWSPAGAELAAARTAELLRAGGNFPETEPLDIRVEEPAPLEFRGDLTEEGGARETLPARTVRRGDGGPLLDADSPVLLLGDSHSLVFSEGGDMHSRDSGFAEHLAARLGMPVDRMANRGSASTPPRTSLFRKASREPEWLENKRVVLYLFTERELTESLNGWRELPVSPRFR